MDGKSVYMKMKNYTPYFFIKLPEKWSPSMAKIKMKRLFTYLSDGNLFGSLMQNILLQLKLLRKCAQKVLIMVKNICSHN